MCESVLTYISSEESHDLHSRTDDPEGLHVFAEL